MDEAGSAITRIWTVRSVMMLRTGKFHVHRAAMTMATAIAATLVTTAASHLRAEAPGLLRSSATKILAATMANDLHRR